MNIQSKVQKNRLRHTDCWRDKKKSISVPWIFFLDVQLLEIDDNYYFRAWLWQTPEIKKVWLNIYFSSKCAPHYFNKSTYHWMFCGTTSLKNVAPPLLQSMQRTNISFLIVFLREWKVKPWGVKFRHFM